MNKHGIVRLLPVLALLLMASGARASLFPLGAASEYGEFILENSTRNHVDAQGKVAVGGNATFNGFAVATRQADGAGTNLVVGGNFSANSSTLHGSAVVGGNAQYNNPTILGNLAANGAVTLGASGSVQGDISYGTTLTKAPAVTVSGVISGPASTPVPIDFAAAGSFLQALSEAQYSATDAFVTKVYGGLTFTGSSPGLNVFNITASEFSGAHSYNIVSNAPAGSDATFIINVLGTPGMDSVLFQNAGNSLTGIGANRVLYNFIGVETLTVQGIGVDGTILAPWADVTFQNGNIDGGLIAKSLTGNGASHVFTNNGSGSTSALFDGALRGGSVPAPAAVPEPNSLALAAIGIASLFGVAWRRSRQRHHH